MRGRGCDGTMVPSFSPLVPLYPPRYALRPRSIPPCYQAGSTLAPQRLRRADRIASFFLRSLDRVASFLLGPFLLGPPRVLGPPRIPSSFHRIASFLLRSLPPLRLVPPTALFALVLCLPLSISPPWSSLALSALFLRPHRLGPPSLYLHHFASSFILPLTAEWG